ncbi:MULTISPECIES: hypothetical protein [unclassified Moraxella]|uniref:hypothetical protein n=1 Tax=unclassified Moraxella TaxID=2685852 RepID=UPI002B407152|nr:MULTISPECIES: hypothetical protein [unclassified Moraxella]
MKNSLKDTLIRQIQAVNQPVALALDGVDTPLFVRRINVGEQAHFAKLADQPDQLSVAMVKYGVCDEDGERIFDDKDDKTILALDAKVVGQIIEAVSRVNFGKEVDEYEKNS